MSVPQSNRSSLRSGEDGASEDGASALLVVLSMFVLLGAAALAVDAGSMWMTKRNFVADTDAAALAAAMAVAETGCDEAEDEAREYLAYNQGGAVAGDASVDCSGDTVTVDFTGQAPMTFAGVLGFSQLDVFSSSTARFDIDPLKELRPLATCISNPIVDNAVEGAPAEIVSFSGNEKGDDLSDCGSPSGNWGWLCFDSNCGANDDKVCDEPDGTSGYLRCGFDPGLDLGAAPLSLIPLEVAPFYPLDDEICYDGGTTDDWCVTKTGSKSSLGNGSEGTPVYEAWEQRVFPILLIDTYDPDKNGRTEAHPKALLWVSFEGYCIDDNKNGVRNWDGDPKTDCKGNNFAFKMAPLHVQWSVDEPLPTHVLQHVPADVRLCGVDHDPAGGNRC